MTLGTYMAYGITVAADLDSPIEPTIDTDEEAAWFLMGVLIGLNMEET